jgi:hypothetical protein
MKNRLVYEILAFFCFFSSFQLYAQTTKQLNCDDLIYTITEQKQKKVVILQLSTIYSNDDIDKELINVDFLDVDTAHFTDGNIAFNEIRPLKLISFNSFEEYENGKMMSKYLLSLKFNSMSNASSKNITALCHVGSIR